MANEAPSHLKFWKKSMFILLSKMCCLFFHLCIVNEKSIIKLIINKKKLKILTQNYLIVILVFVLHNVEFIHDTWPPVGRRPRHGFALLVVIWSRYLLCPTRIISGIELSLSYQYATYPYAHMRRVSICTL